MHYLKIFVAKDKTVPNNALTVSGLLKQLLLNHGKHNIIPERMLSYFMCSLFSNIELLRTSVFIVDIHERL